jgi:hypothetical protein
MLSTARIRSTTTRVVREELPLEDGAAYGGPFTSPGTLLDDAVYVGPFMSPAMPLGDVALYVGPFMSPAITAADKTQISTAAFNVLNILGTPGL